MLGVLVDLLAPSGLVLVLVTPTPRNRKWARIASEITSATGTIAPSKIPVIPYSTPALILAHPVSATPNNAPKTGGIPGGLFWIRASTTLAAPAKKVSSASTTARWR